jgi:hypothetical protein
MGEIANVQQLRPEIVIGYIVLFDNVADSRRQDGMMWSDYFEQALRKIAIRKAPLWNQGLLQDFWLIRFDSKKPLSERILDSPAVAINGATFFNALLAELKGREPAIPFIEGGSTIPNA